MILRLSLPMFLEYLDKTLEIVDKDSKPDTTLVFIEE